MLVKEDYNEGIQCDWIYFHSTKMCVHFYISQYLFSIGNSQSNHKFGFILKSATKAIKPNKTELQVNQPVSLIC